MRTRGTWMIFGVAIAALVLASATRDADARPDYLKEFKANYPKLAEQAETTKCNICHYGDKKTNRNDYGKALAKNLGDMKNVKDAEKIKEVLKKTEKEKSSVEGKTFGDLLEEGKLPGKNP